jgi:hypothetical protein
MVTSQDTRVLSAIREGTAAMRSAAPAGTLEATALIGPVTTLTTTTNAITKQWLEIKGIVYQMNGQQKVIEMLKRNRMAADEYTMVMNSKMPGFFTREVGKLFGMAVDSMTKDVIGAYQQPPRGQAAPGWW